jgi:hypothetical protein
MAKSPSHRVPPLHVATQDGVPVDPTHELLPEPLVPAGTSLRSFDWFPFQALGWINSPRRLRAPAGGIEVMLLLMAEAWRQVPAASLPSDDLVLRNLAGLSAKGPVWNRLKKWVLEDWVLCRDGRYYHPDLARAATETLKGRKSTANRMAKHRASKTNGMVCDVTRHSGVTDAEVLASDAAKSQSQSQREKDKSSEEQSSSVAAPAPVKDPPAPVAPVQGDEAGPDPASLAEGGLQATDPGSIFWTEQAQRVLRILHRSDPSRVRTERGARSLLGRLMKDAEGKVSEVARVLVECEVLRMAPATPEAWLRGALRNTPGRGRTGVASRDLGDNFDAEALAAAEAIDRARASRAAGYAPGQGMPAVNLLENSIEESE